MSPTLPENMYNIRFNMTCGNFAARLLTWGLSNCDISNIHQVANGSGQVEI